jgi:ATP-dependent helicase HrpB
LKRVRLPIDDLVPEIVQHLRTHPNLVLEAAPGAGKTTRVPAALLDLDGREVLVLEPRRIAARRAARYVAAARGEAVGGTVGYQVRFEEVAGPATRLRFVTEGVLTRRMLSDPELRRVGCVVLDEFHERHLEGDLALGLLRRLQSTKRADLRIVVMSATLDAAPIAEYLRGARVMRSEGRQYPLEISYTPHSAAPLETQVAAALEALAAGGHSGHVLVFLPGAAEIRRAQAACGATARRMGWDLLPLLGDQTPEEQDRAVAPAARTKVILATNVAESSITIGGVTAVIDSGVARVASHSAWSGLATLEVGRVSQASAKQRAGRAGRTGPGRAIRLYPLEDFVRRPAQDMPQILRDDLAPAALLLGSMGTSLRDMEWLDTPGEAAIAHAEGLLAQLGATGASGRETAREMARYPLHPRLSRLMVEARRRWVAREGCAVAALLSAGERLPGSAAHASRSDLLVLLEGEWSAQATRLYRQLNGGGGRPGRMAPEQEDALLMCVLSAFPDRVARRRQGGELQLASGAAAQLAANSTVMGEALMVAVEAEDRKEQRAPLVRIASGIDAEWLLDLFPERLREVESLEWNRAGERVEAVSSLVFDEIAIETRRGVPDAEAAGVYLARKALDAGLGRFADLDELAVLRARVEFAARHSEVTAVDDAAVEAALGELATGLRSFAELEAVSRTGLVRVVERRMGVARRTVDEVAPETLRLRGGRQVKVHYEAGQTPWIASRLQDFFGMRETPAVARGAVPVVVRLLAPNQRPVQMTTDLGGFWLRLYAEVRKELSLRYPRHAWPENPLS